jgi:Domain of unknown function (DUF4397)
MHKFLKILAAVVAIPIVIAGCKVNSINYFPPHPATVRVANVMPDAPALNVTVNGVLSWSALTFQSLTGYQSFNNASTQFSISVPGATNNLLQASYPLSGETAYTLVAFGALDQPQALMIQDTAVSPGTGKFQLVVGHVAIGIGAVDIYLTTPGTTLDGVSPTFYGIGYGTTGVVGNFSSGTYQMRIVPTGTQDLIYDSGPRVYGDNTETDVLMYSRESAHLVNVALLDVNSGGKSTIAENLISEVKIVNASPLTGTINALLDGIGVIPLVGYTTASLYTAVPSGAQNFTFEAAATPGATIATLPITLAGATDQSIFLTGYPGGVTAIPLLDNNIPPLSGNVRLRFVNASPDAPPLSVSINAITPVTGLASPTASPYIELAAGQVTFTVTNTATGAVLLTLADVVLTAGETSTIYILGPAAGLGGLVSQDI